MATLHYRLGTTLTGDQVLSWGAKVEKKDETKPNILKFSSLYSNTPQLNDEVLYYDLDGNQVFGGYIQNIKNVDNKNEFVVGDYSVKLSQEKVNAVYENTSPEAIIEDIINNYTDLTFVSTVSTGVTISKIFFRDEWQLDAITKMLQLINGAYSVDLSKNFNLFIRADSTSSEVLTYGSDVLDNGWVNDIQKKAEKVIVLGGVIDQRTTEALSGTGTVFYTSFTPENIEIAGLQQTTENISGDYEVDIYNKKITFNSSQTDPSVSYTYKSQIKVELGTGKTVMLEKKYIESKLEARRLAIEYQTRFADGVQSSKWIKVSANINNFNVGERIYVNDSTNNKTGFYNIKSVVWELPEKMTVEVGETEEDLFDWQKETIERIKQLEKTNSNVEYITIYDFLNNNIAVTVNTEIMKLVGIVNDGTILFASETTLATDADLISDTGLDEDYALAYDDDAIPASNYIDYLDVTDTLNTEDGDNLTTENGYTILLE